MTATVAAHGLIIHLPLTPAAVLRPAHTSGSESRESAEKGEAERDMEKRGREKNLSHPAKLPDEELGAVTL